MYYLNVSSNIISLGGLALAIGVLVDAAIVMVENGYRHLAERRASSGEAFAR
jgi:copper/silver efflux system protein